MSKDRLTVTEIEDGDPTIAKLSHAVSANSKQEVRDAAATALQRLADDDPHQFRGRHIRRIVDAMGMVSKANKARLSYVVFEAGRATSHVVRPVVEQLAVSVRHYVLEGRYSIASNLAFPVGAVAARRPVALEGTDKSIARALSELADCDEEYARHTRHSLMWAFERRAVAAPDTVQFHFDMVEPLLDSEGYPPVLKHGARLIAHLTRHDSRAGEGHEQVAERALSAAGERTVVAGCLALGAIGSERAIDTLRTVLADETESERVRTAARRALREATYPRGATPGVTERHDATASLTDRLEEGWWVAVEPQSFPTRTGQFRGEVTEVMQAADDRYRIEMTNPHEGYTVTLVGRTDSGTSKGGYEDERQSGTMTFECTQLAVVDPGVVSLLYAVEGDHLSFSVDGVPHEITVTDIDHGDDQRRFVGTDEQGVNEIEFRPCGAKPRLALFREGRGFEATDITLHPDGQESTASDQTSEDETDTR